MSGIANLNTRMNFLGGKDPGSRLNVAKLKSLRGALENSYQSTSIMKLSNGILYKALINPDKLKPDYDNRIVSIEYSAEMRAGDTLYWQSNNTYWLVMLQELSEIAYFRANIRRCRHKIVINNMDYYVAVQGPTETKIKWSQNSDLVWNQLNHSLTIYVTKTEDSLNFFQRFNLISLDNKNWQVETVDAISTPGIIQATLGEYFTNSLEELQSQPVITPVDITLPHIAGEVFIKPYDIVTYESKLISGGVWSISDITKAKILESSDTQVKLEIITGKSGIFTLSYTTLSETVNLDIHIESLI